jgi:catechol 2,3-dioxygenase-like lactoylglutathione lyase family enzyme
VSTDPLDRLRMPIMPVDPRPEFAAELLGRIEGAVGEVARIGGVAEARGVAGARSAPGPATVRYFVDDLDEAVAFYSEVLGFDAELVRPPAFAMLYRGDLRLLLSVPGEAHVLPDGTVPQPGGWNRISLQVSDLPTTVDTLRRRGVRFRTGVVAGTGVSSALLQDPAGNPVELFEPSAGYHERATETPPQEEP